MLKKNSKAVAAATLGWHRPPIDRLDLDIPRSGRDRLDLTVPRSSRDRLDLVVPRPNLARRRLDPACYHDTQKKRTTESWLCGPIWPWPAISGCPVAGFGQWATKQGHPWPVVARSSRGKPATAKTPTEVFFKKNNRFRPSL